MQKQLKFGERPAIAVHHKGRDTTVRYDDEKDISAGDVLAAETTKGNQFGTFEVAATVTGTVEFVAGVIRRSGWRYPHTEAEELAEALDPYYDEDIGTDTVVKGVHFPERLE